MRHKTYLTPEQAAELLQYPVEVIHQAISTRSLKTINPLGKPEGVRIPQQDLEAWTRGLGPTPEPIAADLARILEGRTDPITGVQLAVALGAEPGIAIGRSIGRAMQALGWSSRKSNQGNLYFRET